ncbi:MAG: UDP-N-acetylglucosamine--N-acetylmuramyl-(pentapeptide) pyrophosphoryl-undecaprenol N-acetylglucosamine transferase [Elusimicrobia bacterium]|nr:UDP-N-acetylglucosamine--N-acetylmuramyl-(pentapeptide) pyrophosphoryl-undecaprenol N-acetylglucosamine transferase [Elusimicrobiota bacterium]
MQKSKRIIIASGATGGHFYPGFAVGRELKASGWEPLFLVKKDDMARKTLDEAYLPYAEIDTRALPRTLNPLSHIAFACKLGGSLNACLKIISDFEPAVVFGTGSYVSFPALLAARIKGVPALLHESNAKFGLGNYLCARFAGLVALGLPMRTNSFAAKSRLTGTPIRPFFSEPKPKDEARELLGLEKDLTSFLVFGGSQGARRLNLAVVHAVKKLSGLGLKFQLVHVAGRRDFESIKTAYGKTLEAKWLKLIAYEERMDNLYSAADFVVARSGAGTVAELLSLAKPAVLVPLPSSASGHQEENAKVLSEKGAAILLKEGPAFEAELAVCLKELIKEHEKLSEMQNNFKRVQAPPPLKAVEKLKALIEEIEKSHRQKDAISSKP